MLSSGKRIKKFVVEIEIGESYFEARRKRGLKGKLKRSRGMQKRLVFRILVLDGKVSIENLIHIDVRRGYNDS